MRSNKCLKSYFADYLDYLRRAGASPTTIKKRAIYIYGSLSHSIQGKKIHELRLIDVANVIHAGQRHGKYGSHESVITFRCLLKYLRDTGIKIPFNWHEIKIPRVPSRSVEYLEQNELNLLRRAIDVRTLAGLRFRTLIEVLLDTGMRISEVLSLNQDQIDWDKKEVYVLNAKTKEWGTVYFTFRSILWLKKYLRTRTNIHPALFIANHNRMKPVTARYWMSYYAKRLGFKKRLCNHILRRTFTTILLRNRVDIKTVQALARHKSERTTLRYYVGINQEYAKREHARVLSRQ